MVHVPIVIAAALGLTFAVMTTGGSVPPIPAFLLIFSGAALAALVSSFRIARRMAPDAWAWALALSVSVGLLLGRADVPPASPIPVAALATEPAEVELRRAWDGHFRAVADVNGVSVGLLIDTGASLVLLRHDDAVRIGFDPAALDFSIPVTTANGQSFVAPVVFASIRIGAVELTNVRGAVAEDGKLHSSLLGMSFLEGLYETSIRGDRIILRR